MLTLISTGVYMVTYYLYKKSKEAGFELNENIKDLNTYLLRGHSFCTPKNWAHHLSLSFCIGYLLVFQIMAKY